MARQSKAMIAYQERVAADRQADPATLREKRRQETIRREQAAAPARKAIVRVLVGPKFEDVGEGRKKPTSARQLEPFFDAISRVKSMREAAEDLGFDLAAVLRFIRKDDKLLEELEIAQAIQADLRISRVAAINEALNEGLLMPDQARVMIDTEMRLAAALNPSRYGDRKKDDKGGGRLTVTLSPAASAL